MTDSPESTVGIHGLIAESHMEGDVHMIDKVDLLAVSVRRSQVDPQGLTVDRLATAMNDAQITAQEIALGRDLRVPASRILARLSDRLEATQ